jgi:transcriptional regulator of met regulon
MMADHLDKTQAAIDATGQSVSEALATMARARRNMNRLRWASFAYMLCGWAFFIAALWLP